MKNSARFLLGAAVLAATLPVTALAVPMVGRVTTRCTAPLSVATDSVMAEVYAVKIVSSSPVSYTDWGFDLSGKGGLADNAFVILTGFSYTLDDNARALQAPGDVYYVFVTAPPEAAGGACRLLVDSDSATRSAGAMGAATTQYVGARQGWLVAPPANTTAVPTQPAGLPNGTGPLTGVSVSFGTVAEINNTTLGAGCTIGGELNDPNLGAGRGAIIGYNVWRVTGAMGAPPAPAAFLGAGNWSYFVPSTSFNPAADATGLTAPQRDTGMTAGSDLTPNDLAGIQNPDGTFYTGDETLFFQDSGSNPDGSGRLAGTGAAPAAATGYWYAVQPVVGVGTNVVATAFNGIGFTTGSAQFFGNHVIMAGGYPAVDLDLNGTPEFINPQINAGIQGLGLTNQNAPLLSAPVFVDTSTANLPAEGQVSVTARMDGANVAISFSAGLEPANVLGYNVYRVAGDIRNKVNTELLAAGGEGSVYRVVDQALSTSRRVRRDTATQYLVEIVYDGAASRFVGPFDVQMTQETGRRTR